MRRRMVVAAVLGIMIGLTGALVWATVSIDLSDFDEDVMRDMDDTVKALDSDIAAKDAKSVAAKAQSIRDGLRWAEDYFAKKGNVEDAVKLARQGEELAGSIGRSASSNDFDTALTTYDSLVKTCRTCHDAYKPPDM